MTLFSFCANYVRRPKMLKSRLTLSAKQFIYRTTTAIENSYQTFRPLDSVNMKI
jgi:hypothetical protein